MGEIPEVTIDRLMNLFQLREAVIATTTIYLSSFQQKCKMSGRQVSSPARDVCQGLIVAVDAFHAFVLFLGSK